MLLPCQMLFVNNWRLYKYSKYKMPYLPKKESAVYLGRKKILNNEIFSKCWKFTLAMIISGLRMRTSRLPKAFPSRCDCIWKCRRSSSCPAARGATWPEPLATCRLTGGQTFRKVVREIRPLTSVGHCWSVRGSETGKNSTPGLLEVVTQRVGTVARE